MACLEIWACSVLARGSKLARSSLEDWLKLGLRWILARGSKLGGGLLGALGLPCPRTRFEARSKLARSSLEDCFKLRFRSIAARGSKLARGVLGALVLLRPSLALLFLVALPSFLHSAPTCLNCFPSLALDFPPRRYPHRVAGRGGPRRRSGSGAILEPLSGPTWGPVCVRFGVVLEARFGSLFEFARSLFAFAFVDCLSTCLFFLFVLHGSCIFLLAIGRSSFLETRASKKKQQQANARKSKQEQARETKANKSKQEEAGATNSKQEYARTMKNKKEEKASGQTIYKSKRKK